MSRLTTEETIGWYVGVIFGIVLLAIGFNYDLKWITGRDVPWPLDFLVAAALVRFLGAKRVAPVIWLVFVGCLVLKYSGVSLPLLVR